LARSGANVKAVLFGSLCRPEEKARLKISGIIDALFEIIADWPGVTRDEDYSFTTELGFTLKTNLADLVLLNNDLSLKTFEGSVVVLHDQGFVPFLILYFLQKEVKKACGFDLFYFSDQKSDTLTMESFNDLERMFLKYDLNLQEARLYASQVGLYAGDFCFKRIESEIEDQFF